MKRLLTMLIVLLAGFSCAQQKPTSPGSATTKIEPDTVLTEKARRAPHICFVNIANAVEEKAFRQAVATVSTVLPLNVAVAKADAVPGGSLLEAEKPDLRFGKEAKLLVYVVSTPKLVKYASVPQQWALVNVYGLESGLASNQANRVETRLTKMMLKGVGFAAGIGANMDATRCVMGAGSFRSWEGVDQTSASFSPFAGIPMMDVLTALGVVLTGPALEE